MIRFYLKKDPSVMEDEEWAQSVSDILYCIRLEKRMTGAAIAEILSLIKS